MIESWLPWIGFTAFVVGALALDLALLHKTDEDIPIRAALKMTAFWVTLALLFCAGIYFLEGDEAALTFLAGFLIEKSLSVDNLFVFLLVFTYFSTPSRYQPKILFWGVLGAIVMRLIFILAGVWLINMFDWIIYVFGLFLVVTGVKLSVQGHTEVDPERNIVLRIFRRMMPVENNVESGKFFIRREKVIYATPLFVALLMVESSDLVFAMDSIPAILAITRDPFLVYTSNIFAILGLRSLFFALSGVMKMFHYLSYGLTVILVFLGIKMLAADFYHLPIPLSLGFIGVTLLIAMGASYIFPPKDKGEGAATH